MQPHVNTLLALILRLFLSKAPPRREKPLKGRSRLIFASRGQNLPGSDYILLALPMLAINAMIMFTNKV
jgi:hypothetical protein